MPCYPWPVTRPSRRLVPLALLGPLVLLVSSACAHHLPFEGLGPGVSSWGVHRQGRALTTYSALGGDTPSSARDYKPLSRDPGIEWLAHRDHLSAAQDFLDAPCCNGTRTTRQAITQAVARSRTRLARADDTLATVTLEVVLVPHGTAYNFTTRRRYQGTAVTARFAVHHADPARPDQPAQPHAPADIARTLSHELVHIAYKSTARSPANRISDEATATIIGHCAQADAGGPTDWRTAAPTVSTATLDRLAALPLSERLAALAPDGESAAGYTLGKATLRALSAIPTPLAALCDHVGAQDVDFTTTDARDIVTAAMSARP